MSAPELAPDTLAELRRRVGDLDRMLAEGDLYGLETAAHTLKGSALVLGLDGLAVGAAALQHAIHGTLDRNGAARAIALCTRELDLAGAEARLRTLRHELRNDLGVLVMAAGLIEGSATETDVVDRARMLSERATVIAARLDDVRIGLVADGMSAQTPATAPNPRGTTHGGHGVVSVLLVEDDPLVRNVLTAILGGAGVLVEATPSLAGARELLAINAYDIAIVDHQLDDGAGLELLDELRERSVTAVSLSGEAVLGQVGWDLVLAKPVGRVELLDALGLP